ncbi:hypothetical protein AXE80_13040 [Wenyingzhuangia fucanilytica]|uniref:DUF5723 domain-containing protein n=1 Tax=Wenyingzhuangia fucanilytica TaxID=1790137 RepID=A0A1B1Y8S9_9FLAO|nr:hypothetical protein [Wenyingzhuangia fucanilytica]ANW97154.1 hypothetical protein AXE80_13040 [Wenyingzhuangia fucanilytica]
MKSSFRVLLMLLFFSHVAFSQDGFESAFENENSISANLGVTSIGDQTFIGMRVQPEFSFGKFGLGLDVPLLFNASNGEMRTEEFNNGVGILRMVRYLSYGKKKQDPVYVKLGDMTGEQLGYGAMLGNYSNSVSFERRKVGISADVTFKEILGLEAIYSDLNFNGSQKLFAVRPYYRPFGKTNIPVVKTIEFGVSFASDKDDYEQNSAGGTIPSTRFTRDGNSAFGFDVGAILLKNALLQLTWDMQYTKLNENDALAKDISDNPGDYDINASYGSGSGFATGLEAHFKFVANIFHVNARIERQWYGDNYIPQFFNFAYEINKDVRLMELIGAEKSQGIYGKLGSEILSVVKIEGELLLPDNLEDSNRGAIVGINLQTKEIGKFRARGKYLKAQLNDLGDAFKLDQRSLANLLVTYRLNKFMETGVDYQWTFAEKENGSFKAIHQVRPYIGVSIKF